MVQVAVLVTPSLSSPGAVKQEAIVSVVELSADLQTAVCAAVCALISQLLAFC